MFEKLGIDWKLLSFQIANFLLLLFILRKVLYKPLLNLLENRRRKIEEGLEKAEKFEEEWQKIKEIQKEKTLEAEKTALQIVEKARSEAQVKEKAMLSEAILKSEKIVQGAKADIQKEKEKVLDELKTETADFVVFAAEKILKRSLRDKDEKEIIEETLNLLRKNEK